MQVVDGDLRWGNGLAGFQQGCDHLFTGHPPVTGAVLSKQPAAPGEVAVGRRRRYGAAAVEEGANFQDISALIRRRILDQLRDLFFALFR